MIVTHLQQYTFSVCHRAGEGDKGAVDWMVAMIVIVDIDTLSFLVWHFFTIIHHWSWLL